MIRLALLVVATSLVYGKCKEIDSERYVSFPTDFKTRFHVNIREALDKVDISPSTKRDDEFFDVIEQAWKKAASPAEHEVYSDLMKLRKGNCRSSRQIETFKSIYAQAINEPESGLGLWKDFIKSIGKKIFAICITDLFKKDQIVPNPVPLSHLDEVFATALAPRRFEDYDLNKLTTKLSQFDLTGNGFKVRGMMRVIRELERDHSNKENFQVLRKFMLKRCNQLMTNEHLSRLIATMDLNRYLGGPLSSRAYLDREVIRVNEYSRLCLALKTPEMRDRIRANLNEKFRCKWLCI